MIKIGIDPSGTGTTGIVVYKDNKLIKQQEFTDKLWLNHVNCTMKCSTLFDLIITPIK